MESHKSHVPNHQPAMGTSWPWDGMGYPIFSQKGIETSKSTQQTTEYQPKNGDIM